MARSLGSATEKPDCEENECDRQWHDKLASSVLGTAKSINCQRQNQNRKYAEPSSATFEPINKIKDRKNRITKPVKYGPIQRKFSACENL